MRDAPDGLENVNEAERLHAHIIAINIAKLRLRARDGCCLNRFATTKGLVRDAPRHAVLQLCAHKCSSFSRLHVQELCAPSCSASPCKHVHPSMREEVDTLLSRPICYLQDADSPWIEVVDYWLQVQVVKQWWKGSLNCHGELCTSREGIPG